MEPSYSRPIQPEVEAELERILADPLFESSPQLSAFLCFVVERTLAGESEQLKEYVIGAEALKRGAAFNPREDPAVRILAGRLRSKLAEHYQGRGQSDAVVIGLPRGGYVPTFEYRVQGAVAAEAAPGDQPREAEVSALNGKRPVRRPNRFVRILGVVALLVAVLAGVGIWLDSWVKKQAEMFRLEFQGGVYVSNWNEDEVRKGIEYYSRAIALDPNSASAYAGLATGWIFLSDLHLSPREAMPRAEAAAVKAIQINEGLTNAHVSLGLIKLQYEWDWTGAEREFQRAIALDPKNDSGHELYGWYLMAAGRFDEAQAQMKHALNSDPSDDFSLWELGLCFHFARQYDRAIEQYRRAVGVRPKSYWPHMLLGWSFEQQGKFEEAIAELNLAGRLNDNPQVLASLGHAYGVCGRRSDAERVLAGLLETSKRKYISPYDIAGVYAGLADRQQTLAWLEKAYEDRSGWLPLWLKVDPKFDFIRSDPRFLHLLRRIGHAV